MFRRGRSNSVTGKLPALRGGPAETIPKVIAPICEQLRANDPDLVSLNLASQDLGPAAARHLAEGLRWNTHLVYLTLLGNKIGDEGAAVLADALSNNTTLTSLDLVYNSIGDIGAVELKFLLQRNTNILDLKLKYNDISPVILQGLQSAIADNLEKHNTLQAEVMAGMPRAASPGMMGDSLDLSPSPPSSPPSKNNNNNKNANTSKSPARYNNNVAHLPANLPSSLGTSVSQDDAALSQALAIHANHFSTLKIGSPSTTSTTTTSTPSSTSTSTTTTTTTTEGGQRAGVIGWFRRRAKSVTTIDREAVNGSATSSPDKLQRATFQLPIMEPPVIPAHILRNNNVSPPAVSLPVASPIPGKNGGGSNSNSNSKANSANNSPALANRPNLQLPNGGARGGSRSPSPSPASKQNKQNNLRSPSPAAGGGGGGGGGLRSPSPAAGGGLRSPSPAGGLRSASRGASPSRQEPAEENSCVICLRPLPADSDVFAVYLQCCDISLCQDCAILVEKLGKCIRCASPYSMDKPNNNHHSLP